MAEVVAPDSQAKTPLGPPRSQPLQSAQSLLHGKKRAADGELEGEQRLSKRFDLLNLEGKNGAPSRLYIPVPGSSDTAPSSAVPNTLPQTIAPLKDKKHERERERKPRPPPSDGMEVEDTPHRVYIHDLDAELSDIESDEDNPVFLVDIEKHLAKIPKHVLAGPELKPTKDNALILYNVPSSLTVPEEQDRVRKAIVDARARIREKQGSSVEEPERASPAISTRPDATSNGVDVTYEVEEMPNDYESDPDAMDLD
ncbi:hypothetical protein BDV96DRAFT_488627 [Lophiotrema nucula]|uniref:Uncharacterized protein n=1 Tax=Lophiotrema nucula TaxID=690887 RepID=A0A6A5ZGN0_9PLEO|nr:hypothetical protein BDV96DRAFT_488627 [Lophiotrema nucula]